MTPLIRFLLPFLPQTLLAATAQGITSGTVTENQNSHIVWNSKNWRTDASSAEVGTIQTQGDLAVQAGNDINARGATVTSEQGAITVLAGKDINLTASEATRQLDEAHQSKSKGFLSSTTRTTRDTLEQTLSQASTLSGDTVVVQAGHDITVTGSNVVSSEGTTLDAGNDLNIQAATDTRDETHLNEKKKTGLFSSGGLSVTIGTQQLTTTQRGAGQTAAASTIGSTGGDVTLSAGQNYTQTGSDVIAPQGTVNIAAQAVTIDEARQPRTDTVETKFKQSGLTVAVSNPVVTAVQTAEQMSQAASHTNDPRMQALAAGSTALASVNAYNAVQAGQGGTAAEQAGGINVSISIGSSKSQSKTEQASDTASGSTIQAGNNINIVATGAGEASNLTIRGSEIQAGNTVNLQADNQINLLAAENTASQRSTNSSNSASVGIGFSLGGSQNGFTLQAGVSEAKGRANGDDVAYTNTHVTAGNQVQTTSGGDTNLIGATVTAPQVTANVGGDLNIQSLQDTSTYDSKQQSAGVSVSLCIPPFCYGASSGSVSASQSKINSDYQSVNEQSGIKAGDEGFQVDVKGNTDLKGGAITSTQQAIDDNKNSFTTGGELTLSDIQNKAEYTANSAGINIGAGTSFNGALVPQGSGAGVGKDSGSDSSVTQAAISGIAGNTDARTGDAETGIKPIFDAEKVQKEIDAQVRITQTFGQQASKAIGDYAKTQTDEAKALRKEAASETDPDRAAQLMAQADDIDQKWGDNGTLRIAAHTLIGGLTGNLDGALGALAGTLTAPEIAKLLAGSDLDPALRQTLIAIASTTVGAAVGGTAGGATAFNEVTNNYLTHDQIKRKRERLADAKTEEDRQKIIKEYDDLDAKQKAEAYQCIVKGNCYSVFQAEGIESALAELKANCAIPRICGAEGVASIAELKKFYVQAEGITVVYPLETLVAIFATGGLGLPAKGVSSTSAGSAAFGAAANYLFQDSSTPTDWVDVTIAGITGYLTAGKSLWSAMRINATGSLAGSSIKGEDPYPGIVGATLGTVIGYKVGETIRVPLDNKLNPWYLQGWLEGPLTIQKWNIPNTLPSTAGNIGSSISQEFVGKTVNDAKR